MTLKGKVKTVHLKLARPLAAVAILAVTFISGCSKSVDGNYVSPDGFTIDIKGDKANVTTPAGKMEMPVTVEGDKVTIKNAMAGDLVLTRNADGSLTNATIGTLKRKS